MASGSTDATAEGHRTLAESINATTRQLHAQLNKRIVAYLPQALPPRAADPSAYFTGLLHIAPIYTTFETLWHAILTRPPHCKDESWSGTGAASPESLPHVCDRLHFVLGVLHLPGLLRDSQIRRDIEAMTGWSKDKTDQQIADLGLRGPLGSFLKHIKKVIYDSPHLLIAYLYILYMALFAGGRFMRASLESAGEVF
jgi:hypothetical protein